MDNQLKEFKRKNINNICIGSCIELMCLLDNFDNDFVRLKNFINENLCFFNRQHEGTISELFESMQRVLTAEIFILLRDIDKNDIYCDYLNRYY